MQVQDLGPLWMRALREVVRSLHLSLPSGLLCALGPASRVETEAPAVKGGSLKLSPNLQPQVLSGWMSVLQ